MQLKKTSLSRISYWRDLWLVLLLFYQILLYDTTYLFADAVWTGNKIIVHHSMEGLQYQALKHFMDQQ